jgi:dolichol-phosphate mannosyltransferase
LIRSSIDDHFSAEIIVVDDNSPDKTARIVEGYADSIYQKENYRQQYSSSYLDVQQIFSVRVIWRESKAGLVSAVLEGVKNSLGKYILILDADFSHPPNVIVDMVNELVNSDYDIVSASRYLEGSQIIGWPLRRRAISKSATRLARTILGLNQITDPMSGFFAFKRDIISHITFNTSGYKLLLEILVKVDNAKVKEIAYTFADRRSGSSKLDSRVILDFVKALIRLYVFKNNKSYRAKLKRQATIGKLRSLSKTRIPVRL